MMFSAPLDTAIRKNDGRSAFYLAMLVTLAIFTVRLYWVVVYSTSGPFWDQWDAEIDHLLVPFSQGTYQWTSLFEAHNEHRIFFTRLITLALFLVNDGQFDARVECLCNLFVYCAAACILANMLLKQVHGPARIALALFVAVALSLPLTWENIIAGFQSQFYLLFGFSMLCAWLTATSAMSLRIISVLFLLTLSAMFSMASGLLTAFTVIGVALVRRVDGSLSPRRTTVTVVSQAALVAVGYSLLPTTVSASFHAQGATEFLDALRLATSWPRGPTWRHSLINWLPAACLAVSVVRSLGQRRAIRAEYRALGAILLWVTFQIAALAYSRAHGLTSVASRYMDILSIGICANAAAAFCMARNQRGRYRGAFLASAALYLAFPLFGFWTSVPGSVAQMGGRSDGGAREVRMLRSYLATRDPNTLEGTPGLFSYPDAQRVARTLDKQTVAAMMPADIRRPVPIRWATCVGFTATGTPVSAPSPIGRSGMGSYDPLTGTDNIGHCRSEPFATGARFVGLQLTGQGDSGRISFAVARAGAMITSLQPEATPGAEWPYVQLRANGPMTIDAEDGSRAGWLAFTPPVEVGRLSGAFNMLVGRLHEVLIVLGLLMLSGVAALSIRAVRT